MDTVWSSHTSTFVPARISGTITIWRYICTTAILKRMKLVAKMFESRSVKFLGMESQSVMDCV